MLLEPGIYGTEFNPKKGPFGLRCGQMKCGYKMYHNASWYNKLGQKIGWGDLSEDNLLEIKIKIPSDELFIILGEHDSYWNLTPEEKIKLPIKYILKKYRCVISNDGIHLRDMCYSSRTFSEDYKEAFFAENSGEIAKIDGSSESKEVSEV